MADLKISHDAHHGLTWLPFRAPLFFQDAIYGHQSCGDRHALLKLDVLAKIYLLRVGRYR